MMLLMRDMATWLSVSPQTFKHERDIRTWWQFYPESVIEVSGLGLDDTFEIPSGYCVGRRHIPLWSSNLIFFEYAADAMKVYLGLSE